VLESPRVADEVWSISKRHFIYRLVLDLEQLESFPEGMMGQIALLQERLVRQGGALRLCGLSPACEAVVQECALDKALPNHASREDAVLGEPVASASALDKPPLVATGH
jgi:anti-anti-sigma regulatory factor